MSNFDIDLVNNKLQINVDDHKNCNISVHRSSKNKSFYNIWFKVNTTNNHKNNTSVSALVGEEKKF